MKPGGRSARYEALCATIKGTKVDGVEVCLTVVDAVTKLLGDDSVGGLGSVACSGANAALGAIYAMYKGFKSRSDVADTPNPYFVLSGHEDTDSPVTLAYTRSRLIKGVTSNVISLAGTMISPLTMGMDSVSAAQHVNATASTIAHIVKLAAIAKSYKQSDKVSAWINLIQKVKIAKTVVRGGQIAGALIPAASLGVGLAATVVKLGIKLSFNRACLWAAVELHWRAFQEQAVGSAFTSGKALKGIGPASRILYELFMRRGATRILGQYDVNAVIHEPCGWQAVADKVLQL